MQCDFSKVELEDLAFAVMDRRIAARKALEQQGMNAFLERYIPQQEALYQKLTALMEQADATPEDQEERRKKTGG